MLSADGGTGGADQPAATLPHFARLALPADWRHPVVPVTTSISCLGSGRWGRTDGIGKGLRPAEAYTTVEAVALAMGPVKQSPIPR
jgi:hypothetical protein